jgi:hypothetical protein
VAGDGKPHGSHGLTGIRDGGLYHLRHRIQGGIEAILSLAGGRNRSQEPRTTVGSDDLGTDICAPQIDTDNRLLRLHDDQF